MFILQNSSQLGLAVFYPLAQRRGMIRCVPWLSYLKYLPSLTVSSLGTLALGVALLLLQPSGPFLDTYAGLVLILVLARCFVLRPTQAMLVTSTTMVSRAPVLAWVDIWAFLFSLVAMDLALARDAADSIRTMLVWGAVAITLVSLLPIINLVLYRASQRKAP